MKKTKKEIADFYDNYVERQLKSGANERLRSLYKKLVGYGLNSNSEVLELGCGVGVFTKLLQKKIKSGKIEAVDLSEKSIEIASNHFKAAQVSFYSADIVDYVPRHNRFDFITLFDVIEHIPLERHSNLFQNVSKICSEETLVCINIPNPEYINYLSENRPESLQIIDQAVPISLILKNSENANLELLCFEKYSIWHQEDYHFLTLRKKKSFDEVNLANNRSFVEKVQRKLRRIFNS